jgi:hypothetical protein
MRYFSIAVLMIASSDLRPNNPPHHPPHRAPNPDMMLRQLLSHPPKRKPLEPVDFP